MSILTEKQELIFKCCSLNINIDGFNIFSLSRFSMLNSESNGFYVLLVVIKGNHLESKYLECLAITVITDESSVFSEL